MRRLTGFAILSVRRHFAPGEEGMTTTDAEAPAPTGDWIVPASAIAFALLFVAGALTAEAVGSTEGKTADQIVKSFHDSKGLVMVSVWVLMLAGLAFVPLAWGATRRVSAGLSALGEHVARTSSLLFVGLVFVGAAAGGSLAVTGVTDSEKSPPADLIRFFPPFLDPLILIGGGLAAGVFLAVISRAGQRASAVPTWFSVLGYVAAVAMLGGIFAAPIMLLPVWALAAAFVLRK
jgi:hypothetical protein